MIKKIVTLEPGKTIYDPVVTGLHVRALRHKKVYMLYYRTKSGVERRPKIGDVTQITLQEARRRSRIILGRVAVGEDPKGQWDEQRAEKTVLELFNEMVQKHWNKKRFQDSGWAKEVSKLFKKHLLHLFGAQKLSTITTHEIRHWHQALKETPYAANRALEVLTKMFNYAISEGHLVSKINPCRGVMSFTEKKRIRFATPQELVKISELLKGFEQEHPIEVAFIYLLLYSGSRPRALERAKRSELKVIEINGVEFGTIESMGKSSADSGEVETIIIPPQALKLLKAIPEPKDGTLLGIQMPRELWNKVRQLAQCEDLRLRDFRRTFCSLGMQAGLNIDTLGELLNHKSAQTTMIYAKLGHVSRIKAADIIAKSIDQIVNQAES